MTIREIAQTLGVSPAAVSFVLNRRPGVGAEKRRLIEAALRENGYELRAQERPSSDTKHIKFIKKRVSYQNDCFAADLLDAVTRYAVQRSCQISMAVMPPDADCSALFAQEHSYIDGLIYLASSFTQGDLKKTMRLPFPAVYLDFEEDPDNFYQINTINADNYHASYLALRHLFSLGHRQIGYLKSIQQLGCLRQRFQYFQQHLSTLGGHLRPEHVIAVDMSQDSLAQSLLHRFSVMSSMPTAFVAENDVLAVQALNVLQTLGYRVPDDISLIGFDNSQISTLVTPKLSTIDVNVEELAQAAIDRLLCLMAGPHAAVHMNVGVRLIKRSSTA